MSKTPVVRVEGTEALLSVVPVLLGYEPADSVVLLTVRDRRVGMTARVDLPQNAEEAHAMVDSLVPPILRQQPESVFLIGYEKVTTRPLTAAALKVLAAAFATAGVPLAGDLVVVGERGWEHLECDCCAEPHPVERDSAAALALRVSTGVAPAASRAEVAARVQPSERARDVALAASRVSAAQVTDEQAVALAWGRLLDPERDLSEVPDLVLALAARGLDRRMRDALLGWLCPGSGLLEAIEGDPAARAVRESVGEQWGAGLIDRLCQICAALPDGEAVPSLTVLAGYAWWAGNGTVAWAALDRAKALDPTYRMAELLRQMVGAGIPFPGRAGAPPVGS